MKRHHLPIPYLALSLGLLLAVPGHAKKPSEPVPEISFGFQSVRVTNMTPAAEVLWIMVGYAPNTSIASILRWEELVTGDADGSAEWALGEEVPRDSVWFAIDLETGTFASRVPDRGAMYVSDFPGNGLGAALNYLQSQRDFAEAWIIRPGSEPDSGFWGLAMADGGAWDSDNLQNNSIHVELANFEPLGGSPEPPNRLSPGDVVIVVNPNSGEYFANQVAN